MAEKQATSLRRFYALLMLFLFIVQFLWIAAPLSMAILWSLVDPDHPWSYPQAVPEKLSFHAWQYVFKYTSLVRGIATSYTLAPFVVLLSFVLSLPTAYALGRMPLQGKKYVMTLVLLPIIMPGMARGT